MAWPAAGLAQELPAAGFVLSDLGQRDLEVLALLLEQAPVLGEHGQEGLQLRHRVRRRLVHVDETAYLPQAQAEALAAQCEFCLLYTSDAADELARGDSGGARAI